ncbi:MAG: hypothetical protein ABJF04_15610 [Reichenbachiella sp.]|uniref:hypothetical protein n=1 Tax=Reichenbachiella sp. TaxID=2184521 RepID=UPI003266FD0B
MKIIHTLLVCIFVISASCSEDSKLGQNLTLDDFKKSLSENMGYTELVNTFGVPSDDVGSGLHIYVYPLLDQTKVHIGFAGDNIVYAYQMNSSDQLIYTLID